MRRHVSAAVAATMLALCLCLLPACGGGAPQPEAEPQQEAVEQTSDDAEATADESAEGEVVSEEETPDEEAQLEAELQSDADGLDDLANGAGLLDENGAVTVNALLTLDGSQLGNMLAQSGYAWVETDETRYLANQDESCLVLVGEPGAEELFDQEALAGLGAGGEGTPVEYLVFRPGSSMDDPLVGVDKSEAYRIDVREGYVAYSFNHVPSGRRYFVTVADADEAGFVYVCVYNQEAVEGDFLGEEDANIINEVWL